MKNKNKKPLKKYQSGGGFDFFGSNLFNPSASDVNMGLFGRGFLDISNVPKQYMNLGDNPFGAQLMSGTAKSAQLLGTIPGVSEMGDTMPEWGGEYAQKMKQDVAKEKGLKYNEWSGKWTNDKGEVYTNRELEDLAGQRYDTQKAQREQLRKFQPMLAPLLQLNELGEMQKRSYQQAQKTNLYDVTNKPMGMETRGFFAKEGMRTPPITEVYRMMGAHQGLPQTSFNIPNNLKSRSNSEYNKLLDSVIMEEGGNLNNILYKEKQNNMYNNNQRVSRLAMLLGGGLIRNYQDGGMMQQPMSQEEAMMQEQMMQEAMMQDQMAQEQMAQQQMGQQQTAQPQQPGQNKYMQLPQEQQVEVYKMLIDYIMINGIDALEQQFPEEYQFFEDFSDQIEGEEEGGEEMETEANRMEMGGEEEQMYGEEEAESEFPTDEEEVPVGARPGENAMRPAETMEGAPQMKQGGIPERYRKMGFNKVGQKRQSDRPGKKWAVLAKKGDQYKIVHGGAKGMSDFTQHKNKDRQKRFWDRMGGKDSAKANDPFSPLFWHKRFGTWILLSLVALL